MENNVFELLSSINVNEHVEKKNTGKVSLSYLSWCWAWAEVKKRYPDAFYEIRMFDNLPYSYDPKTGYMVYTTVTINNITHMMWLPVMDSHNEAMLDHPRTVKTKYSEYTVDACTMFDVNKTIMRCLTKNIAMFGLGLYIFSGEDIPESEKNYEKEVLNNMSNEELIRSLESYIASGIFSEQAEARAKDAIESNDVSKIKKAIEYAKSLLPKE